MLLSMQKAPVTPEEDWATCCRFTTLQ